MSYRIVEGLGIVGDASFTIRNSQGTPLNILLYENGKWNWLFKTKIRPGAVITLANSMNRDCILESGMSIQWDGKEYV